MEPSPAIRCRLSKHMPSNTVSVKDEEWRWVGVLVDDHFDAVAGISFLPMSDHSYEQAPYQDMDGDEFMEWNLAHPQPEVDWADLSEFDKTDNTVALQTLA